MLDSREAAVFIFKTYCYFLKHPFPLEGEHANYGNHVGMFKLQRDLLPIGNAVSDPYYPSATWTYCSHCSAIHDMPSGTPSVFRYWCNKCATATVHRLDDNIKNPRAAVLRSNPGYTMYCATDSTTRVQVEELLYNFFTETVDK